jgi:DNA-binding NtrC family response regulator
VEDIPLLIHHYLGRVAKEMGKRARKMAPEAMEVLMSYSWPGNVIEVQSVVKTDLRRDRTQTFRQGE